MSSVALEREEVEKQIRALLNSTPAGLTVFELRRDFHEFIGSQIPFRTFGYNNVEDYFNDIPKVITPVWENGRSILKATANETTRHIEKMVSRQKVTNKNKWAALRKNNAGYSSNYSKPRYFPPPSVPVSIRQQIRQMFRQTKSLPLTHFDNFFYKRFGSHLDHEWLGFTSVKKLLESIPETVTLIDQHGEWRVLAAHFKFQQQSQTPLQARNRKRSLERPNLSSSPNKKQDVQPAATLATDSPQEILDSISPISSPSKSIVIDVVPCSPPKSDNGRCSTPEQEFDDPVHKDLKLVLNKKLGGIMASRLALEYKSAIGKDLPFKEYGYHSVIEFVNDIPNVVRIERPNPSGDWILYDASLPTSILENKKNVVYAKDRKVSTDIKEAIKQVLQIHPDGITMNKFPAAFQDYTGKHIELEAMGFSSFESLLLSLTDDVLQATYKGKECVVLSAKDSTEPRQFNHLLEKYQPHSKPVVPEVKTLQEKHRLPNDCILPGTYYTCQKLPDITVGYIEVFVSNIVSPGLFWLQLRGRRSSEALENLMDDLSDYYMTSDSARYKIPDFLYMVGQLCAVIFPEDQNWHRGIITGIRSVDAIEVYFVDYGNTCTVQKESIRLLRSRFRKLPAQAIQARLANVKPVKENWSLGARDRLLEICINKPLVGFLTSVKDRVLSLCLTDTSQEEDVHLNDLLVGEGYANFAPDELHPTTLGPTNFAQVPGDDLLYGLTVDKSGISPPITTTNTIITTSTEDNLSTYNTHPTDLQTNQRYIQIVDVTPDHSFHLINFYNSLYILSSEISALFWANDLLSSELVKKDSTCSKTKVIKREHGDLFQELLMYSVPSITSEKQVVSLYALEELPKILELFNHPNKELKAGVMHIVENYSPDDSYWKGEDEEKEDFDLSAKIAQELEDSQLDLGELQLTLKAIQFKRTRILEQMMSHTGSSVELVNQLHEVEVQIAMTTEVIEEVEKLTKEADYDEESEEEVLDQGPGDIPPETKQTQFNEVLKEEVEDSVQPNVKTNRVAPMVINPSPSNQSKQTSVVTNNEALVSSTQEQQNFIPNNPESVDLNHNTNPSYPAPNQDLINQANFLQQQQQYLLQSMMVSQMDPSMSGMMPQPMQYQQMMPNPIYPYGYQYMGNQPHAQMDPQNALYYQQMMMANPNMNTDLNRSFESQPIQQTNYLRMPGLVNRFPVPNYSARLPIPNTQTMLRPPGIGSLPGRLPLFPNSQSQPGGAVPTAGATQPSANSDSLNGTGILPNLLPLLQSLNLGRGKPDNSFG